MEFINEEWITPLDPMNLIFDEDDVIRIQLITELKEHLGVNDEAIPIILHLVDQLHLLHSNLQQYS